MDTAILAHQTAGVVLVCEQGVSFWGGVDVDTGSIQDVHHPQHGLGLAGKIVLMPTSRGSCSGSGVLLELAMTEHAPAALVFHEAEDILTLGALIAAEMFACPLAVLQLTKESYRRLSQCTYARIGRDHIEADGLRIALKELDVESVALSADDRAMLDGEHGESVRLSMRMVQRMGAVQGAADLVDVSCAHIDGCIYACDANLVFAEAMAKQGARVRVPTTINAISVDLDHWQTHGVSNKFGQAASRLAMAYVSMGAEPTFTCAPYLSDTRPREGEAIAWSESNAVIYANSVLGACTVKHPDYFDLFVALTGRAPRAGVYLPANRQAQISITVAQPEAHDESFWPLLGWVLGQCAPDRIPRVLGIDHAKPHADDLKALCAAFGTTSAAPLLHIQGVTPEGEHNASAGSPWKTITRAMLAEAWMLLNSGPEKVDLVALGSPHFSLMECRRFASLMRGQVCADDVHCIITLGRNTYAEAHREGLVDELQASGVRVLRDLCWCSITEPLFPSEARHLVTNSGKYAHYAPGLCHRSVRFASLAGCAQAAVEGYLARQIPEWLCAT